MTATRCWVLTEGHQGMENQALGVAEAMGLTPAVKRLWPRFPWSLLPPRLWPRPLAVAGPDGDKLEPPWPDLVISCGKRGAVPALAVKTASGGTTFVAHIQSPPVPAGRFDLVVVPEHDSLRGDNVVVTTGSLHRVTPERLNRAAAGFADRVAALPKPRVAVLVGGNNRRYRLTPDDARRIAADLTSMSRATGAGLMITTSRRTGAASEAVLRQETAALPTWMWDGAGENPYFGFLGLADAIVVTCDSVSMISEAVATGKPVYLIRLDGRSRRIESFHQTLLDRGMARWLAGDLAHWDYPPLDETARIAAAIRARMGPPT